MVNRFYTFFLVFIFCIIPFNAAACSCGAVADRLSEMIGEDEVIFWGVPINPNVEDTSQPDDLNLRTEFKVLETFQGDLAESATVFHESPKSSSCGMTYLPETPKIVYAVRNKEGVYKSYYCMGFILYQIADFRRMTHQNFEGAHKANVSSYLNRGKNELDVSAVCRSWLRINYNTSIEDCKKQSGRIDEYESSLALKDILTNYFTNGKDARVVSELCLVKIKQAYDAEIFTGKFEPDKECEYLIPYYDSIFRYNVELD